MREQLLAEVFLSPFFAQGLGAWKGGEDLAWINFMNNIRHLLEHYFFNFVPKTDYWELLLDSLGDALMIQ